MSDIDIQEDVCPQLVEFVYSIRNSWAMWKFRLKRAYFLDLLDYGEED